MAENRPDVDSLTSESGTWLYDMLDSHRPIEYTGTVVMGIFRRMSYGTRSLSTERCVLFQTWTWLGRLYTYVFSHRLQQLD